MGIDFGTSSRPRNLRRANRVGRADSFPRRATGPLLAVAWLVVIGVLAQVGFPAGRPTFGLGRLTRCKYCTPRNSISLRRHDFGHRCAPNSSLNRQGVLGGLEIEDGRVCFLVLGAGRGEIRLKATTHTSRASSPSGPSLGNRLLPAGALARKQ